MIKKNPAMVPFFLIAIFILCAYGHLIWLGVFCVALLIVYGLWQRQNVGAIMLISLFSLRLLYLIPAQGQAVTHWQQQEIFSGRVAAVERYEETQILRLCLREHGLVHLPVYLDVFLPSLHHDVKINDNIQVKGDYGAYGGATIYRGRNKNNEKRKDHVLGYVLAKDKDAEILHRQYTLTQKIKDKLGAFFSFLPQNGAEFFKKLLLNEKMSIEQAKVYRELGLAHILAISGLHIGILIFFLDFIFKRFIKNRVLRQGLILFILFFYLGLIGIPISALRAISFYIVYSLSFLFKRRYTMLNTLFFVGILFLLYDPGMLWDLSFQLSFLAVLSIAVAYPKIASSLSFSSQRFKSLLSIGISTQLFLLPIQIYYFGYVNIFSVFINILFLPLLIPFVLAAMVCAPFIFVWPALAHKLFSILNFFYQGIALLLTGSHRYFHFAKINAGLPPISIVIIYLVMLCIWFMAKHIPWKKGFTVLFLIAYGGIFLMPTIQYWVYFLDVGQGDGAFIETPKHNIMIDTGGNHYQGRHHYEKYAYSFLRAHNIARISEFYASHYDIDHIGNLPYLLADYPIGMIVTGEKSPFGKLYDFMMEPIERKGLQIESMKRGDVHTWEKDCYGKALWPPKHVSEEPKNQDSLVLEVGIKDKRMLFTGDITKNEEPYLFSTPQKYDIIKVAHHGSKDSTTEAFLKKAKADYYIISVGKNRYGHPAMEVLQKLKRQDGQVLRTDLSGEIAIRLDGPLKVFTFKDQALHVGFIGERMKEPYIFLWMFLCLWIEMGWIFVDRNKTSTHSLNR